MSSATDIASVVATSHDDTTSHDLDSDSSQGTQFPKRVKWYSRVLKQGPWIENEDPISYDGTSALPMPVEVSDKESLAPFFAHLRSGGVCESAKGGIGGVEPHYNVEMVEFGKGVLYADGRVDLCKMVTGPRNIGDLMESLKPNTFAKHFLLGNNIIGPTGAKAIADFINTYPDRFETWYLAGNCIDTESFTTLVNAMIRSPVITNVWLKRNPLRHGAAGDVFRLITQLPALRTLDLDQTELGDRGIANLFSLLAQHDQPIALRHIYLNGSGIGALGCEEVSRFLQSPHCRLESLYMSNNPIGDSVALLSPGLKKITTLQRLVLQSCGLKDKGTLTVLESLNAHPSLQVLDLGQSYATEDLGMRYNWITCADALCALLESTPLQYLNLSYTPIPQSAQASILRAAISSPSLLWFTIAPLVKGGQTYADVKAGQEAFRLQRALREHLHHNVRDKYDGMAYVNFESDVKRFLLSPGDVRLIDSVYRNRDAGMARRGLKTLDKWWEDGDDTLARVSQGIVD